MSGRHSLVALAVGLALSGQTQAQLLISEYLEGSSNNKAVELSNLGATPVDLSQYRLALYANGKPLTDAPTNSLTLQGTLAPGASLVLALMWCLAALALASLMLEPLNLLVACGLAGLALWGALRYFKHRLQGFTGDCLGATQQVCEIAFYLGLALSL